MRFLIRGLVEDEGSLGVFVLVTVLMGGLAAWLTGRAIAQTWRPFWHLLIYIALLGAAVRFVHFALFEEPLLSPVLYAGARGRGRKSRWKRLEFRVTSAEN
jgi:hypothetical protein